MDLDDATREPLNRHLMKTIYALIEPREPVGTGGSWQTDPTLHERTEFSDFMAFVSRTAKGALKVLDIDHEGFQCTGCWANINPTGAFHVPHTHPNNYLSGVYYVKALDGADGISFHDPRPQQEIIAPHGKRDNRYNTTVINLRVKAGRLVIFPAWFVHSVPANKSAEYRISISFNIMLSNFAETVSRPKWAGMAVKDSSIVVGSGFAAVVTRASARSG